MTEQFGETIGRYRLLQYLGQGGMATVFKAYDPVTQAEVAIKVIRSEKLTIENAPKALRRFRQEARQMAQLTHPDIVRVFDNGDHNGLPFLVMKYIAGGTLKDRLGKPIHWAEAAKLLLPIARALEHAHNHQIVHRDVKPANILLTKTGRPMLTDFGIAKALDISEETASTTLTATGTGVGTPEYMAPEQAKGKDVDHRADIYALGIVFYELVTGCKPFTADTPLEVLVQHLSTPLPNPRKFVKNLPSGVENVLFRALAKQPKDRFQTMGAFATALEHIAAKPKTKPTPSNWLKTILILIGGIGLVGLVVFGVAFLAEPLGKSLATATATWTMTLTSTSTTTQTLIPTVTQSATPTTTLTVTSAPTETPTETPLPTETSTGIPTTAALPTQIRIPTNTRVPILPTNSVVPPTNEPPTNTPVPQQPPTNTPVPQQPPTNTPVPELPATNTPVP